MKVSATLIGVRMAGPADFTPAHIPTGAQKPLRQMASFHVYANNGENRDRFKVTAWGKLADAIARSGAAGKKINLVCDVNSYEGRVSIKDNTGNYNFALDSNGAPIMTWKIGFIVRAIDFGEDSEAQKIFEIQNGMRPLYWEVAGHPDRDTWKQMLERRNAEQFVPGSARFGFARVITPRGQLIDPSSIGNKASNYIANTGTAQYNQAPPVYTNGPIQQPHFNQAPVRQPAQFQQPQVQQNQYVGNPAQVANGMPPYQQNIQPQYQQSIQPPTQPVMIHGQNMGYAPPVQGGVVRM